MQKREIGRSVLTMALIGLAFLGQAGEKHWKAGVTGSWAVSANWVGETAPAAGDAVFVTNTGARVVLSSSTPDLGSLTLGQTLVFTNWSTSLKATNVTILSGGVMTLPIAFTAAAMSNRVWVACSNLTVAANGRILTDGLGYTGAAGPGTAGNETGAGHGGRGGRPSVLNANYGSVYGSITAPVTPGSGGGHGWGGTYYGGGPGGGVVRIEARGSVVVNGILSANGLKGSVGSAGGGAGGSVSITCRTFGGDSGLIQANGAKSNGTTQGGGGGGGRIAVVFTNAATTGVRFEAAANAANTGFVAANDRIGPQMGTLYLSSGNVLADLWRNQVQGAFVHIPGFTSWSLPLVVSNAMVGLPDGFVIDAPSVKVLGGSRLALGADTMLSCAGDLLLDGATLILQEGSSLGCAGNMMLTNASLMKVYSGPGSGSESRVRITNSLLVCANSWIHPHSNPTTGGAVVFSMHDLRIAADSGFNADGRGYEMAKGPGSANGLNTMGAGHGGRGGNGSLINAGFGAAYDDVHAPTLPGSGGGAGWTGVSTGGGDGGGVIRIDARGTVTLDGTLTANGINGYANQAGGGSGGTVSLTCHTFGGTMGGILATGGKGVLYSNQGGGGGGGRLAVHFEENTSSGIRFGASANARDTGTLLVNDRIGPQMGTLSLSSTAPLADIWKDQIDGAVLHAPGFTSWNQPVVVSNALVGLPGPFIMDVPGVRIHAGSGLQFGANATLASAGDVTLDGGRIVMDANPLLTCGGSLTLTNGSTLKLHAGPTNGSTVVMGGLVRVVNDVRVSANSWVYPNGNPTNGATLVFVLRNLLISANSGFNANGLGYQPATGSGAPTSVNTGSGAGHGGAGGGTGGGAVYGSSNAPIRLGSGGANGWTGSGNAGGGHGGGAIQIQASGTCMIGGMLTANGADSVHTKGGGGSGGSVLVFCKKLTGPADAVIRANGGKGGPGGGGGGRVALWVNVPSDRIAGMLDGSDRTQVEWRASIPAYQGLATSALGTGTANGQNGTVVYRYASYYGGTVLLLR